MLSRIGKCTFVVWVALVLAPAVFALLLETIGFFDH